MFARLSALSKGSQRVKPRYPHQAAPTSGVMSGLAQGTLVATAMGWRPAEGIVAGDKVLTFDAGLKTVTKVVRTHLWSGEESCPKEFWPLEVPSGVLGNREVMHLLPHQTIMVESNAAEDIYGDPFSLIPSIAMEGLRGIHRVPPQYGFEVVQIYFAEEQVIFAKNGTLYFCPSTRDILDCVFEDGTDPLYTILPIAEARDLAAVIEDDIFVYGDADQDDLMDAVPA